MGTVLEKLFIDPEYFGVADGKDSGEPYGMIQLLFQGACYAYILMQASGMIGEGSELLLLTPFRGLVGSVVLPVLGAVPDGAIILFSGATQKDLAVGVGALAGSTIMLLTIPWCLAIVGGRVDLNSDGVPNYQRRPRLSPGGFFSQLGSTGCSVDKSIGKGGLVMALTAVTYLVIQIPALQGGCGREDCGCEQTDRTAQKACIAQAALEQQPYALAGLILAAIFFIFYVVLQYKQMQSAEEEGDDSELAKRQMFRTYEVMLKLMQEPIQRRQTGALRAMLKSGADAGRADHSKDGGESQPLLPPPEYTANFNFCMKHLFNKYNTDNSNNFIDGNEIVKMETELHFAPELSRQLNSEARGTSNEGGDPGLSLDEMKTIMWRWAWDPVGQGAGDGASQRAESPRSPPKIYSQRKLDQPMSPTAPVGGTLSFAEVQMGAMIEMSPQGALPSGSRYKGVVVRKYAEVAVVRWNDAREGGPPDQLSIPRERAETKDWWNGRGYPQLIADPKRRDGNRAAPAKSAAAEDGDAEGDEDDEEEEMPEDIKELPESEQQAAIWKRSLTMMCGGTFFVLLFSDPLVGILGALGDRLGVPAFYISFILAPLASNGTELLCAYNYALKKTEPMMTTALSSLLGAACMNNTFCLAIFLLQIWQNGFVWEFTAETISILAIELVMLFFAMSTTQKPVFSILLALMFPGSVALVYCLENFVGLD